MRVNSSSPKQLYADGSNWETAKRLNSAAQGRREAAHPGQDQKPSFTLKALYN